MSFSEDDIRKRFFNIAKGKCECCNKDLVWENRDSEAGGAWHAHHVDPEANPVDSVFNMAILCINKPCDCHLNQAHGGDYKTVMPKKMWKCKNNAYLQMMQQNIK
jgi:hypothetical protein